jgi:hypothetical protein
MRMVQRGSPGHQWVPRRTCTHPHVAPMCSALGPGHLRGSAPLLVNQPGPLVPPCVRRPAGRLSPRRPRLIPGRPPAGAARGRAQQQRPATGGASLQPQGAPPVQGAPAAERGQPSTAGGPQRGRPQLWQQRLSQAQHGVPKSAWHSSVPGAQRGAGGRGVQGVGSEQRTPQVPETWLHTLHLSAPHDSWGHRTLELNPETRNTWNPESWGRRTSGCRLITRSPRPGGR